MILSNRGMFHGMTSWVTGGSRTGLTEFCDIDHMISSDAIVALPLGNVYKEIETKEETLILGICTTEDVHCGYTRLIVTDTGEYLPSSTLKLDESVGPAFTVKTGSTTGTCWDGVLRIIDKINNIYKFNSLYSFHISGADIVPCIRCPVWPQEAAEWLTRERRNGWPSQSLVKRIARKGCHFVAKAHSRSRNPDLEFRFSFSVAEDMLLDSWQPIQIHMYNSLKNVKTNINKQFSENDVILCSYHLKTLMLWAVEEKPSQFWSDKYYSTSMKQLICELAEWFIDRRCPCYFLPNNNIFDHIEGNDSVGKLVQLLIRSTQNAPFLQYELRYLVTSSLLKLTFYDQVSNVIKMKCKILFFCESLKSEIFIVYELCDLYSALRGQVDFVKQSAKLSVSEREKGLQILQQRFRKAIKSDERLVEITIEGEQDYNSDFGFMESFRRQLHPSRWKRTSMCSTIEDVGVTCRENDSWPAASVNRQNEGENNNGLSPSINMSSYHYKFSDAVLNFERAFGQGHFADESQKFSDGRLSKLCAMSYLANFYYIVCGEYDDAITVCDEVIGSQIVYDCALNCSLNCDDGWAVLFDDDIQSLLGFTSLYDTLHRLTLPVENPLEVKEYNCSVQISARSFAQYIKIRCLHKLCIKFQTQSYRLALHDAITSFAKYIETPSSGLYDVVLFSSKMLFWTVIRSCCL